MASVTASAHLRGNLVYDVAERTDACRPAFVASDTPVNLQMSHVNPFCLNALLLQNAFHFVQGCRCITVGLRAAIEDNYFHFSTALTSVTMPICCSSGLVSSDVRAMLPGLSLVEKVPV